MATRKKSNKKEIYDIATGTKIEIPEDDKRAEMAAAILTGNGLAVEEDPEVEKELNSGFLDELGTPRKLTDPIDLDDETRELIHDNTERSKKKEAWDARKKLENDRIGRALHHDPYFLSNADGLAAALRDTNKEMEVATPYGNYPVDFVMNSIYSDVMRSPSPTDLLKCCLRELMLIRLGRVR